MSPTSIMRLSGREPTSQTSNQTSCRGKCIENKKDSEHVVHAGPLAIPSRQQSDSFTNLTASSSTSCRNDSCEDLQAPQVVDFAPPQQAWPQRESSSQRVRRVPCPSISSEHSSRQSEIAALGIIDSYLQDRTSLYGPGLQQHSTLDLDSAIEQFDFGLPPTPTLTQISTFTATPTDNALASQAISDEKIHETPVPKSPLPKPSTPKRTANPSKGCYSLFPVIHKVSPVPRGPEVMTPVEPVHVLDMMTPSSSHCSNTTTVYNSTPSHPDVSYRPRKESISSSIRSRADSLLSSMPLSSRPEKRPVPLRILSSPQSSFSPSSISSSHSTPDAHRPRLLPTSPATSIPIALKTPPSNSATTTTTTYKTSSPPTSPSAQHHHPHEQQLPSRWSDDTILTSPTRAQTTPVSGSAGRTSFGSWATAVARRKASKSPSSYAPDSFMEFDDGDEYDEEEGIAAWDAADGETVPLRRKLASWRARSWTGSSRGSVPMVRRGKGRQGDGKRERRWRSVVGSITRVCACGGGCWGRSR